jgi:G2/M phase-specific E3 ubiquitin-protein ligase
VAYSFRKSKFFSLKFSNIRIKRFSLFYRDASWELEENAFAELLVRPKICEAEVCCCPEGPEYVDESDEPSDWDFLICKACGSKSQHRKCAGTEKWICVFCSAFVTENGIADSSSSSDESENEDVDVEEFADLRLPVRNSKRRRRGLESETEDSPVRPNKRRRVGN